MIWYKGQIAGIISGASCAFKTAARDRFFGINDANRKEKMDGIICNSVTRLINHEYGLQSRVLAVWEEAAAMLWQELYNLECIGLETFIITEKGRYGHSYMKAGWKRIGESKGSAKVSSGLGKKSTREKTDKKRILAKRYERDPKLLRLGTLGHLLADDDGVCHDAILTDAWLHPSWETKTVRDKSTAKIKTQRRKPYVGKCFTLLEDPNPSLRYAKTLRVRDALLLMPQCPPLPDGETFTVYRGIDDSHGGDPRGVPWTFDPEVARRAAGTNGTVYRTTVTRADIYGYSNLREQEVVLFLAPDHPVEVLVHAPSVEVQS